MNAFTNNTNFYGSSHRIQPIRIRMREDVEEEEEEKEAGGAYVISKSIKTFPKLSPQTDQDRPVLGVFNLFPAAPGGSRTPRDVKKEEQKEPAAAVNNIRCSRWTFFLTYLSIYLIPAEVLLCISCTSLLLLLLLPLALLAFGIFPCEPN